MKNALKREQYKKMLMDSAPVILGYLRRVGNALSQLANTVFLNGHPNESISGRAYREGWTTVVWAIDRLMFFDKNHCYEAHIAERVWCREIIK